MKRSEAAEKTVAWAECVEQKQKELLDKLGRVQQLCASQGRDMQQRVVEGLRAFQGQALEAFLLEENLMWTYGYHWVPPHQEEHRELWGFVNRLLDGLPPADVRRQLDVFREKMMFHFQTGDKPFTDHLLSLRELSNDG